MHPCGEPTGVTGHNYSEAAILVRISLSVFMGVKKAAVVKNRGIAFGNRFQLRYQVGELLHMPLADITQNSLAVFSVSARRFAVRMSVIVVARSRETQPREA
jgi:hypothetical protein